MANQKSQRIVVACTGASGMLYARLLLEKLENTTEVEKIGLVFSGNARQIWQSEIEGALPETRGKITVYEDNDFYAPFASGSSQFTAMVVCPASMGMLGRISNGVSDCLITRATDVMLKERRKLVLVLRDTPYNLIHIRNMEQVTLAGGIICPATPSFYTNPQTVEQVTMTVVDRIVDLLSLPNETFRWGGF
jgi:4-hydroxy-3-polyprenylbenzoate decarboxylase